MMAFYLLFLAACGNEPVDNTISIAISPTSKTVELGDSVELTVTAKNTKITWPDSGAIDGSFTINGNKATYVPPSIIGTYRFTVVAEANPSKSVTAKITVVFASPEITITPETSEIKIGKTVQLKAEPVIPTGQPQIQDPTWEVTGDCGTIDTDGVFGLFSAAREGNCTVKASLRDINNKKITATATVKIKKPTLDDILGDMVQVRGGTFTMGCTQTPENCYGNENPAHQVTLNDFYIGKYEVTQFVWKQIKGEYVNPSFKKSDNLPVEKVSWDEIQEFIEDLNELTGKSYRLPTEAEWEYAARGGNQGRYAYSGSNKLDEVGWYIDNSNDETHPVGMKKANELGIYDMSGNVDEWVSDWFGDYSEGSQNNPTGPSPSGSTGRVVRGGSSPNVADFSRISKRGAWTPGNSNNYLGFRLALTSK